MPEMGRDISAAVGSVELTVSGFLIGFSLGQLVWGPLGDRYGRRLPVAAGLLLFVLGSAGCGMSSTVDWMIFWRIMQALGACSASSLLEPWSATSMRDRERHRGGFFYAGIYAYIAGTPFAFITYYHVPPGVYGLLFAIGIVGIIAANMANARLVSKFGSKRLLRLGALVGAAAGVLATITARAWVTSNAGECRRREG
jgi:MFS family permease